MHKGHTKERPYKYKQEEENRVSVSPDSPYLLLLAREGSRRKPEWGRGAFGEPWNVVPSKAFSGGRHVLPLQFTSLVLLPIDEFGC